MRNDSNVGRLVKGQQPTLFAFCRCCMMGRGENRFRNTIQTLPPGLVARPRCHSIAQVVLKFSLKLREFLDDCLEPGLLFRRQVDSRQLEIP